MQGVLKSGKIKALCHFPSLQSTLLTALNIHITEGKRSSKKSQLNALFSLMTLPVLFTHLLPVIPEERLQSVPRGACTEGSTSSLQPTSCLGAAAALPLPRSLLRGRLWQTLLFSHFCKDPRLSYTPRPALRAGYQHHLGRNSAARGHSGWAAASSASAP